MIEVPANVYYLWWGEGEAFKEKQQIKTLKLSGEWWIATWSAQWTITKATHL